VGPVPYEHHIYENGQVSTRANDWHDLFNALVWCRLPRFKSAMNAVHYRHLHEAAEGRRGRQRDALTLLDENGAVVLSPRRELLDRLARRDWQGAFQAARDAWTAPVKVLICGHALLEKFLRPYKAVTAHVLLVHLPAEAIPPAGNFLGRVDEWLAARLLAGRLVRRPRELSPLPLAGVPGWWTAGPQDAAFYDDRTVFRPPAPDFEAPALQDFDLY
jgi:hypothetical protein